MAELSPFESYTIYKKREKLHKQMYILQHHWRDQMIQILFKFKVQQQPSERCYLSKGNSFEPLMAELSPFESYTIYKKREKFHKNM